MSCAHEHVEVFSRIVCYATREEPAEYEEWGTCLDCGAHLEAEDIPEDAEVEPGEYEKPLRGMPSEFYD